MNITVKIDGVDHHMQAQLLNGTLWIHANDRTFNIETGSGNKSRKKSNLGASDVIMAPMPGKVTKILFQAGDLVKAGHAVLIMEAMKMEYTLKSDIDGLIESVSCSVGDQVVLGKALVKIKLACKE